MLTDRQIRIVKIIQDSSDIVKSREIANILQLSSRTVMTEIKHINILLRNVAAEIESVSGKGYVLHIDNPNQLNSYLNESIYAMVNHRDDMNNKENRIHYILNRLLIDESPVKIEDLADELYVSLSSIQSDLRMVKRILENYDLTFQTIYMKGICISGAETSKRMCIIKEKLNNPTHGSYSISKQVDRSVISDAVITVLTHHQFLVSDAVVQNLILHIYVSVQRMLNGSYINSFEREQLDKMSGHLKVIAQDIYSEISCTYSFIVNEYEIYNLMIYLYGRRIYSNNQIVTKDIDDFIYEILALIRHNYQYDFTNDLDLRMDLALHLLPLIVRAKSKMLISNALLSVIKNTLLIEYNFAILMRNKIEEKYSVELDDDETGYLAVYFSRALNELKSDDNKKNILVITSIRTSEMLLLKLKLHKEFFDYISQLNIVNVNDVTEVDLYASDVVLTTCGYIPKSRKIEVISINYFITDNDKRNIREALLNDKHYSYVYSLFERCTFLSHMNEATKEQMLETICDKMELERTYSQPLFQAVMNRERYGSTAYVNGIAITHPLPLEPGEMSIGVAIAEREIIWENDTQIQIAFLVTGTNEETGISRIYELISRFISERSNIEQLLHNQTFENFMDILSKMQLKSLS